MLEKHSGFEDVPEATLVPAQQRGTSVHDYCFAIAQRIWPEPLHPLYKGYGQSFEKFWPEVSEVLFVERLLRSTRFRYYGHPDIVVRMRQSRRRRLIDLKTGPEQRSWKLQLSAYWYLLKEEGIEIDEAGALILDPDGDMPKWKGHPDFILDFSVWLGYVNFYHYIHGPGEDSYAG